MSLVSSSEIDGDIDQQCLRRRFGRDFLFLEDASKGGSLSSLLPTLSALSYAPALCDASISLYSFPTTDL